MSTGGRSPVDKDNGNGCACQLGGGASWGRPTRSFVNWDLRVDWEVRVNWGLRAYSELRSPRGCSSSWSPTRLGSWLRGWVNIVYVALQTLGQTFPSLSQTGEGFVLRFERGAFPPCGERERESLSDSARASARAGRARVGSERKRVWDVSGSEHEWA